MEKNAKKIKIITIRHTREGKPNERKIEEEMDWRENHGWQFISRREESAKLLVWLAAPWKRGQIVLEFEWRGYTKNRDESA